MSLTFIVLSCILVPAVPFVMHAVELFVEDSKRTNACACCQ